MTARRFTGLWARPPQGRAQTPTPPRPPFAQDWVEPAAIDAAWGPLRDRVVHLAGTAGDLALHLLAAGARLSAASADPGLQAHLDLRAAALRRLPHQSYHSLLGLDPAGRRLWFYHFLRDELPAPSRAWWDAAEPWIRQGLAAQGRHEDQLRGGLLRRLLAGDPHPRLLRPHPTFAQAQTAGYAAAQAALPTLRPTPAAPIEFLVILDPAEPIAGPLAPGARLLLRPAHRPPPGARPDPALPDAWILP